MFARLPKCPINLNPCFCAIIADDLQQKIADLITYIENNRDGLYGSRFLRDKVETKRVPVCGTGAMEKNIDVVIDRRFKKHGMS